MKERPILMRGDMVSATLEDRKTNTRRVMNPQPMRVRSNGASCQEFFRWGPFTLEETAITECPSWANPKLLALCPYGQPGDRLWVRESGWISPDKTTFIYADLSGIANADGKRMGASGHSWSTDQMKADGWRLRPSIHMPRWASRLTLEITDVRVERVQEISAGDAMREGPALSGMLMNDGRDFLRAFIGLWESINGVRPGCSWADNPWVWALTFKVVK